MLAFDHLYEQIVAYLRGSLSNRQRHELEKKMMRDAFDGDAFDGFEKLSAEALEKDMERLSARLQKRVARAEVKRIPPVWRMAASILLIAGIAGITYFWLRPPTEKYITQEMAKPNRASREQSVPSAGHSGSANKAPAPKPSPEKKVVFSEKESIPDVIVSADDASRQSASPNPERVMEYAQTASTPEESKHEIVAGEAMQVAPAEKRITGRVTDINGEPLPGVNITEQGSPEGTVTDMAGNFVIDVQDPQAMLTINYIGYITEVIPAAKANGESIALVENITALDEVVVIGYGTRSKKDITGAVSTLDSEETAAQAYDFIRPVPPGGDMKSFRGWVMKQIDPDLLAQYQGKNRLQFIVTIGTDGSIGDIVEKSSSPPPLAEAFRQAIAQSPPWKPALKNGAAIEARVNLRFALEPQVNK
jgi:hypothetical protein